MGIQLTGEEKRAIALLRRLEKSWPSSLWLFSGSGTLNVMRCGEHGEHVMSEGRAGGVNPDYCVTTVDIPNDGGDW